MLTLRLPVDDRSRGLAERGADFVMAETFSPIAAAQPPDKEAMAQQLALACRYGGVVERVAARHGMLPSVIAGFCSRRSAWGLDLSPEGVEGTWDLEARAIPREGRQTPLPPDDLGFLRGLMGLDFDRHELARGPQWRDPESNLDAAFGLISDNRTTLRRRTTLQGRGLLRAALAAFECGVARVEHAIRAGLDVDSPTRGCGADVLTRAGFFQAAGWD